MDEKPGFRFSLRALASFVAVSAAWCAAFVNASEWTGGVALLVTALSLVLALVATLESRGGKRSFWRGFTICGWLYLLLAFANLPDRTGGIVTQAILFKAAELLPGATPSSASWHHVQVGQAGSALLFAVLGGLVGRWFHGAQGREWTRSFWKGEQRCGAASSP